jgi:glycosyltransferase involved in cell wall biosynthesis
MRKITIAFLFPSMSRRERLKEVPSGSAPKDFFYGYISLKETNRTVHMIDTRANPDNTLSYLLMRIEYYLGRIIGLNINKQRVYAVLDDMKGIDIALSFTDSFSLSLGLCKKQMNQNTIIAAGFHGLTDTSDSIRWGFRWLANRLIKKSLDNLDHLFFFGPADLDRAIKLYHQPIKKVSLLPFGVDLDFWNIAKCKTDGIFSVGSDLNRDYDTLLNAKFNEKLQILTRKKITVPDSKKSKVKVLSGSLHGSEITDKMLRGLYQESKIIIVPLFDVWQPTGYSVTLQAMACGKPVILSDIRGLWDRDVFQSGKNCILVPPGNIKAMGDAINLLMSDSNLREGMSIEARKTAKLHFSLSRMDAAVNSMVSNLEGEFL